RAQMIDAAPAGGASAAADPQMDGDAITRPEGLHSRPDLLDDAGRLVPGDVGAGRHPGEHRVAVVEAHVPPAEARRLDGDEHLAVAGLARVHLAHLDLLV